MRNTHMTNRSVRDAEGQRAEAYSYVLNFPVSVKSEHANFSIQIQTLLAGPLLCQFNHLGFPSSITFSRKFNFWSETKRFPGNPVCQNTDM